AIDPDARLSSLRSSSNCEAKTRTVPDALHGPRSALRPMAPLPRGTCGTRLPSSSPEVNLELLNAHAVVAVRIRATWYSHSSSLAVARASPLSRCRTIAVGDEVMVRL